MWTYTQLKRIRRFKCQSTWITQRYLKARGGFCAVLACRHCGPNLHTFDGSGNWSTQINRHRHVYCCCVQTRDLLTAMLWWKSNWQKDCCQFCTETQAKQTTWLLLAAAPQLCTILTFECFLTALLLSTGALKIRYCQFFIYFLFCEESSI